MSAVFLIAFFDGKVLSARNERGWDVPGGHREGDEDCLTALRREDLEELLRRYDGDKNLLRSLIEGARKRLGLS